MTSYLVDAILMLALLVTAVRMTKMRRELKQLRVYETEFNSIMGQTADAFDNISRSVHDLNVNGAQLVHLLGIKIDEARDLLAEIDRRRSRAAGHADAMPDDRTGEQMFSPRSAVARRA